MPLSSTSHFSYFTLEHFPLRDRPQLAVIFPGPREGLMHGTLIDFVPPHQIADWANRGEQSNSAISA